MLFGLLLQEDGALDGVAGEVGDNLEQGETLREEVIKTYIHV